MRIRSTKPEFWRSERIASVDWDARFILKGLESYVDDNGVGKDDLALIVGDLFQRDLVREPSRTLARVSEGHSALHDAGLLWRYEGAGTPVLFVAFWETFQRIDKPGKGRLPRPDGTFEYGASEIRESVANPREGSRILAPGTGEQGNRGAEEQGQTSLSSEVADATVRPEIDALLDLLDDRIRANGSKAPTRTKKNRDAARLLLDKDGHTVAQVQAAIEWATTDEFWRSNILSMSKLREKYDQLRLAATSRRSHAPAQSRVDANFDVVRHIAERDGLLAPQIGA